MRFTSLIVELIRARPVLVFWLIALAQAGLWFILPVLLYSSPPGDVALNLAYGREYLLGSIQGPPLSFWLADIAFRAAGNNMFGVYLLAQVCFVVSFWAIFRLGRAIVGAQHSAVAVLLTVTISAFAFPSVEFGPHILAQPLWALTLLSGWRIIGEGRRNAWFALSIHAGLLLLTTHAAPLLLAMLAVFALATARGRRMLLSFDPLFALIVVVVLVVPYAMFVMRTGIGWQPPQVNGLLLEEGLWRWLDILGGLALALAGVVLLVILNSSWLTDEAERAPVIFRPSVDPLGAEVRLLLCDPAAGAVQHHRGAVRSAATDRRHRNGPGDGRPWRGRGRGRPDLSAAPAFPAPRLGSGSSRRRRCSSLQSPWRSPGSSAPRCGRCCPRATSVRSSPTASSAAPASRSQPWPAIRRSRP